MRKSKTYLWAIVAIIIIVIAAIWINAMTRMGEFSRLSPRFGGKCETKLKNIAGIEDFKIIGEAGKEKIVLSSFDRLKAKKQSLSQGAVFVLDFNSALSEDNKVELKAPNGLMPVGIDVIGSEKSKIGVINLKNGANIEIFENSENHYAHTKTIKIDGASRLNDVAFYDDEKLFVTNESEYSRDGLGNFFANLLDLDKSGGIYFYDGKSARKVADGLTFANSLAITKDKKYLFASATLGREIRFYEIQPNFDLKLLQKVFIGTGIDNLSLDDEGRIFAGAHPKLFTLARKSWFGDGTPPAQAIVIEPKPDFSGGNIDQVYLSDGKQGIGSVSVAAKYQNQLIMGSIFDNGIMICDLPSEWHQSKSHPANRLIDTNRDYQIKKAKKDLGVK